MPPITGVSVTIRGLRKEFGSVSALDGIDIDIDEPAIVGLVGPDGAGKTTLIQCLLGLREPTAGLIRLNGTPCTDLGRAERRRVGYIPQEQAVYRDLTVRENVGFFARLYRVTDCGAAVNDALEFVGLRDRADARIDELSGGMVRRTSLACTLMADPEILCFDEPTVSLDPKLRAEMWDRFRERREDGALLLVSTHYLGEAHNCDKVLFLRDGRVLAFDAPEALLDRTDAADLEAAFLSLLDSEVDGSASADDPGRTDARSVNGGVSR